MFVLLMADTKARNVKCVQKLFGLFLFYAGKESVISLWMQVSVTVRLLMTKAQQMLNS